MPAAPTTILQALVLAGFTSLAAAPGSAGGAVVGAASASFALTAAAGVPAGPLAAALASSFQSTSGGFSIGQPTTLLRRIPSTGAVPIMFDPAQSEDPKVLDMRAEARNYLGQLRGIRRKHFDGKPRPAVRDEGVRQLREFVDPAAFKPMLVAFRGSAPETLLEVYAFLASRGPEGEAALAWEAMVAKDKSIRDELIARLTSPPSEPVLREIDRGLRDNRHAVANAAGYIAGALGAIQAIPLLIFSQAAADYAEQQGDLAWIVVGTQNSYVANVIPVVGDNAGAFQPVLGMFVEGTLLRVMDAVVVTYRIDAHNALVSMANRLSGTSTEHLGYDMPKWYAWYNQTLVPMLEEKAKLAALIEESK